ncbi:MAG TPA: hypothetical protein PKA74_09935 [Bauldia sp.]|nr:hypothetical protein [Bauldia sp.]
MRLAPASAFLGLAIGLAPTLALADAFSDPASMQGAIKGTMEITFDTRTATDMTGKAPEGSPALGARDKYALDLDILNSIVFRGSIERQPWIPSSILGRTLQPGYFDYDMRAILKNPANPAQTVTLGGWVGGLTVDGNGEYFLAQPPEGMGELRIATDSIGSVSGFVSKFGGEIQGRVPEQAGLMGLADRASKRINKTYSRLVDGKTVTVTVEGADPLEFQNVVLAQGPLAGYPESRINGSIDYDPEEGIWYLDIGVSYNVAGAQMRDRYSGTIRWNEDPNRDKNGMGAYEVNVRLNEKPATEADAFAAATGDAESAFFAADVTVPGFTGKVSYVDTFEDESVVSSKVTYSIDANAASKIQTMTFAKMLLLMVGPFNDE